MFNTPPCYNIYLLGLVLDWLETQGGVTGMEAKKSNKAAMLYDFLDESGLFTGCAERDARSDMNVTFRTGSKELDALFAQEAAAAGLQNLKGHRSVGGMRASLYNAMPVAGVEKLVAFMKSFEVRNHV
jgi:phosphoserine aminotransferase